LLAVPRAKRPFPIARPPDPARRERLLEVTPELAPPCLGCGTCCFSALATFVRVDGFDHARLGARGDELTVFIGNRCHMTMHDGHCAALVIDVTTRRFVCSV
jgi:hypothetical protein